VFLNQSGSVGHLLPRRGKKSDLHGEDLFKRGATLKVISHTALPSTVEDSISSRRMSAVRSSPSERHSLRDGVLNFHATKIAPPLPNQAGLAIERRPAIGCDFS
jgi:hypothetical protein